MEKQDHGWTREQSPTSRLIQAGREAWLKGLIHGVSGNMSICQNGLMYITRSGTCKGRLQAADVIRMDVDSGAPLDPGRVSSEVGMHRAVYVHLSPARAIVHVHPTYVLALEQSGVEPLSSDIDLYEAAQIRSQLAAVPALLPGSSELARAVAEAAGKCPAVYMTKHGLTCWGESLEAALNLAEDVEGLAKVQFLSGIHGRKE
ncbi:MAG: class II aldolase/adducin family protein [Desulfovermiculus sp.]